MLKKYIFILFGFWFTFSGFFFETYSKSQDTYLQIALMEYLSLQDSSMPNKIDYFLIKDLDKTIKNEKDLEKFNSYFLEENPFMLEGKFDSVKQNENLFVVKFKTSKSDILAQINKNENNLNEMIEELKSYKKDDLITLFCAHGFDIISEEKGNLLNIDKAQVEYNIAKNEFEARGFMDEISNKVGANIVRSFVDFTTDYHTKIVFINCGILSVDSKLGGFDINDFIKVVKNRYTKDEYEKIPLKTKNQRIEFIKNLLNILK